MVMTLTNITEESIFWHEIGVAMNEVCPVKPHNRDFVVPWYINAS